MVMPAIQSEPRLWPLKWTTGTTAVQIRVTYTLLRTYGYALNQAHEYLEPMDDLPPNDPLVQATKPLKDAHVWMEIFGFGFLEGWGYKDEDDLFTGWGELYDFLVFDQDLYNVYEAAGRGDTLGMYSAINRQVRVWEEAIAAVERGYENQIQVWDEHPEEEQAVANVVTMLETLADFDKLNSRYQLFPSKGVQSNEGVLRRREELAVEYENVGSGSGEAVFIAPEGTGYVSHEEELASLRRTFPERFPPEPPERKEKQLLIPAKRQLQRGTFRGFDTDIYWLLQQLKKSRR
jgi:hypothetical protein